MLKTQVVTADPFTHGPQLFEEVCQGRSTYEFKGGLCIPLYPSDIWIVRRGVVQLSTVHCDGEEAILGLVYPNMPFGLPLTQMEPYEPIALSTVELMRISQAELEQSPMLAQGILSQLNRRLQQTEALLSLINQRLVSARLQALLLLLTQELGQVIPGGVRIQVRLTHQQLANLVGTTRISVTRILGYFRKEGWLSIDQTRHMVIHDAAALSVAIHCCTTEPTQKSLE